MIHKIFILIFLLLLIIVFRNKTGLEAVIKAGNETGPLVMRGNSVYSVRKLWKLTECSVQDRMKISQLSWNLNRLLWETETGKLIKPRDVLKDPEISKMHYRAILKANLHYPILLRKIPGSSGKFDILDGLHRLCKAIMEDRAWISVKIVPKSILQKARIGDKSAWPDPGSEKMPKK